MEEPIANCPQCDSDNIDVDSSAEMETSAAMCRDCEFYIAARLPEQDLIMLWNHLKGGKQ
jgi:hypothetical protein